MNLSCLMLNSNEYATKKYRRLIQLDQKETSLSLILVIISLLFLLVRYTYYYSYLFV